MKTNKDLIFSASVAIWILSNILSFIFYKCDGVAVSNLFFILLFCAIVFIKIKNKRFSSWLENKLHYSK